MASISGNGDETRNKIKRVQEFLDQEIERVKELKNLLSISEAKVTQLKGELAKYKATIAPTPINSCPPEILSMIFKLSVPEDGNIHHIGCLLLVCRRWHTLIMHDPQMWNNIRICVPDEWNIRSWSKLTRLYIDSCIERSDATGLDIELDFHALRTIKQQIRERFRYGLLQPLAPNRGEADQDRIDEWLECLDYDKLEGHEEMTDPCLPGHALDLIDQLVGIGGKVGLRWESLTLRFPSSKWLASNIWNWITRIKVINLSRIHFIGFGWVDLCWRPLHTVEGAPILSLPQVKDLRVKTLVGWERFLSFEPFSIQRLAVDLTFEEGFFSQLARFSHLRILTLSYPGILEDLDVDTSATNRISIPTLEELVLIGEFGYLDTVTFDLPNPKQMRIDSHGPIVIQPTISTIRPLEIYWAAESEPQCLQQTLMIADNTIRSLLLSYTSSDRFSVTSFLKDNTLKVLNELSKEGALPPGWKTVSFHDTSDDVETMCIDYILSS